MGSQLVQPDERFDFEVSTGTIYTLSRIPADETTRMLRRHTKKKPGGEAEVDSLTFNREYRDRAIHGWRKMDGDPPCTIETKMQVADDDWREIQKAIGAANIDELRAKEFSLGN